MKNSITNSRYKPAIIKLRKESAALHKKAINSYAYGFWMDGEASTKKAISMEVSAALLERFKH